MRGRTRALSVLPLLVTIASCDQGDSDAKPDSPWLITWDSAPEITFEDRVFRAHRARNGKAEHVDLASVKSPVSWSPSRRWMAYETQRPNGARGVSLQRFDGDRWYEPQPLEVFGSETASISSYQWSPTSDQLLYTAMSSSAPLTWALAVATPRDDGP